MRVPAETEPGHQGISPRPLDFMEELGRGVVGSYQKKMARYLFEIACMDELSHFASRRTLPGQALKYFRKVMGLYDESTQYFLSKLHRRGMTVQCKPECAHCCSHMPSGISTMELIYLYQGLRLTGVSPRLFRRCLEAEELWVELLHRHTDHHRSERSCLCTREEMLKSYQGLSRPCPFLQAASCLVYPFRPFACRMHFSLSPPHWCGPSHFQNAYAVRFNIEPGECVQDALGELDNRFGLNFSDIMVCGLLELTVNVMQFEPIHWT